MRKMFFGAFALIAALALWSCTGNSRTSSQSMSTVDVPESQVTETVDSLAAGTEQVGDSKDKIVVLDFFATWCGPCKVMAPAMEKMEKKYAGKIEFRKVDVDQEPELAAQYNIQGVPTLVVLSPDGKILDSMVGAQTEDELDKMFTALQ